MQLLQLAEPVTLAVNSLTAIAAAYVGRRSARARKHNHNHVQGLLSPSQAPSLGPRPSAEPCNAQQ
jgi:hypothetical protein